MIREPPMHVLQDRARMALRNAICRGCPCRPAGSEDLPCEIARSCEAGCRLFKALPQLCLTARCIDPMITSFEKAMHHRIQQLASQNPEASADDPLVKYEQPVVQLLGKMVGK